MTVQDILVTIQNKSEVYETPYLLASAHLTNIVSTTGLRSRCSLALSAKV